MRVYQVKANPKFVGRKLELERISEFVGREEASILVVHGRRRVGKTELIEQAFAKRNLLKFEGVQGKDQAFQRGEFLRKLAYYADNPDIGNLNYSSWIEVFERLADCVKTGSWTIYLEELQWLADYKDDLISELKYVWDNNFRRNSKLRLVLCGSSVSYFRTKVLRSRALYNRSIMELPVKQFSLAEAGQFYHPANSRDLFDAYLTVGGIPEYLREIKGRDSLFIKIKSRSEAPGGFFVDEFERIFVSSLAEKIDCRLVLETIGKRRIASRDDLLSALGKKSGAGISGIIDELVQSELIEEMNPLNLAGKNRINRYKIQDYFLSFFFSFIYPNKLRSFTYEKYRSWLGYAFERYCRYNSHLIASLLGFGGIDYESGAIYNRASIAEGVQIDLAFKRGDKVITICEIKYLDAPVGTAIVSDFERKVSALNLGSRQLQRVLISASGVSKDLERRSYFDRIINLDDIAKFGE